MPFYILILTNTYSNVKSDTLKIMLSNLIILSDLLHHLVHHFHIKLHHFMIQFLSEVSDSEQTKRAALDRPELL